MSGSLQMNRRSAYLRSLYFVVCAANQVGSTRKSKSNHGRTKMLLTKPQTDLFMDDSIEDICNACLHNSNLLHRLCVCIERNVDGR